MYLTLAKGALSLVLFLLWFISLRQLVAFIWRRRTARQRLSWHRQPGWMARFKRYDSIYRHLQDLVEVTRFVPTVSFLLVFSSLLALGGVAFGAFVFQSFQGVVSLLLALGSLPYLYLRVRLISHQLHTRLEFLPAVEVFYQQYTLAARPNIRLVLQETVMGERLLYPVKSAFVHLHRNLSAGREPDDALRVFELEMGHVWATYFANLFRMSLQEGLEVGFHFKELIEDMRRAQMYDQRARNRLLEIRLASFSPLVFLALFLAVNFKLNSDNAYRYYFLEEAGRTMLLHALLLIFASFLMGIYLSMRRM